MSGQKHWNVISTDGDVLASAPTEGQAWLKAIGWDGWSFDGWDFFLAVGFTKEDGIRAVEEV